MNIQMIEFGDVILSQFSTHLFTENDIMIEEFDSSFVQTLSAYDRIIYSDIAKVPGLVFQAAADSLTFIIRQKPMMEGRLELLNYFIEQSISHSYHRYGNIGSRGIK